MSLLPDIVDGKLVPEKLPVFLKRGQKRIHDHAIDKFEDENFEALQNLRHEPNSEDFADSMFADRKPI